MILEGLPRGVVALVLRGQLYAARVGLGRDPDCDSGRLHTLGHSFSSNSGPCANRPWRRRVRSPAPKGSPSVSSCASGGERDRSGVVAVDRRVAKSLSALLDWRGRAGGELGSPLYSPPALDEFETRE